MSHKIEEFIYAVLATSGVIVLVVMASMGY